METAPTPGFRLSVFLVSVLLVNSKAVVTMNEPTSGSGFTKHMCVWMRVASMLHFTRVLRVLWTSRRLRR